MAVLISNADSGLNRFFTSWLFAAVLLISGLLGYFVLASGLSEHNTLLWTRYTARVSFVFFLPVFTLQAVHLLLPTLSSRFLMRKRRQLGLAFALAHGIHLVAIILHYRVMEQWFTADDTAALVIYLLIGLMAITSNSFSIKKLQGSWRVLHKVGLYAIFVGFFITYLGRVQNYDQVQSMPQVQESFAVYVVLLALVSIAWAMRITAFWVKRSRQKARVESAATAQGDV